MKSTNIILISMFVLIEIQLLWYRYKPIYKRIKKHKKDEAVKSLVNRQIEDELVIEKDKDIASIDEYVQFVGKVVENYNQSRSKKIAYKTRQELLIKTVDILPIISKYIKLEYYYNLEDKEWYNLTDRDMILLLESSFNDYTHDNLESLNSIISASLRLRDDKR